MALSTLFNRSTRRTLLALTLAVAGCTTENDHGDLASLRTDELRKVLKHQPDWKADVVVETTQTPAPTPDPRVTPPDEEPVDPGETVDPEVPEVPGTDCGDVQTFETGKVPTRIVHVDDTNCSDSSGNGSEQSPYCTITRALQGVVPGTAVRLHEGTYTGGANYTNLIGTSAQPIWIGGAPGEARPKIVGGDEGLKFSAPLRYLVLHDMEISGSQNHNINIDDGGNHDDEQATRYIVVRDISFHHAGDGSGIDNCLKVSGINEFAIHDNDFFRCGMGSPASGSGDGIDLVGCHHGVIARNFFHTRKAVQVKGGSEDIEIRANRSRYIDEGTKYRAFNIGGSTALQSFRPSLSSTSAEARNIRFHANVIEAQGAAAAFALAGCVDCLVANNTILNPDSWVGRILWENKSALAPRNGRFVNNLVYWDSSRTGTEFQVGDSVTTAGTFTLDNNLWFDWRSGTHPNLDSGLTQTGAIYADPSFVDQDFHIGMQSPAAAAGVPLQELTGDFAGTCWGDAPSIGAFGPVP